MQYLFIPCILLSIEYAMLYIYAAQNSDIFANKRRTLCHLQSQNILPINEYMPTLYSKKIINYGSLHRCFSYYVSQFTVETYCFADGRCLFKRPRSVIYHWNQYDEEISKKCRSVRLSVCNANKKAYSSFIIDSRKIIQVKGLTILYKK